MKKFLFTLFIIAFSFRAFSQDAAVKDTSWKKGGFVSIMFNQVSFSHWAGGGVGSLSLTGIGNGFANYQKGKNYWNSFANIQYGITETQYERKPNKNIDVFELQTK